MNSFITTIFFKGHIPSIDWQELAKAPTKFFLNKLFKFCALKSRQRYSYKGEKKFPEMNSIFSLDGLRRTLRAFVDVNKKSLIPCLSSKMSFGSKKQEKVSSLTAVKLSWVVQRNNAIYRSVTKTTHLASFASKSVNFTIMNSNNLKLLLLAVAKLITYKRTHITMLSWVK